VPESAINRCKLWLPRGGEVGRERVAKVVEPHDGHTSLPARGLEALGHLACVQRIARLRMREHELARGVERRPLRPPAKLLHEPVRHRYGSTRGEVRLALAGMLATDICVANPDPLRTPAGVAPAKAENLDCRRPVIAAVRASTGRTGPRAAVAAPSRPSTTCAGPYRWRPAATRPRTSAQATSARAAGWQQRHLGFLVTLARPRQV